MLYTPEYPKYDVSGESANVHLTTAAVLVQSIVRSSIKQCNNQIKTTTIFCPFCFCSAVAAAAAVLLLLLLPPLLLHYCWSSSAFFLLPTLFGESYDGCCT